MKNNVKKWKKLFYIYIYFFIYIIGIHIFIRIFKLLWEKKIYRKSKEEILDLDNPGYNKNFVLYIYNFRYEKV